MFDKLTDSARQLLFLEASLHIAGNRELIIENCRKVLECSDVFMSLAAAGLTVQIWGSDLRASDYRTNGLVIRGKISQIELTERRARHERPASRLCEDKRER